MSGASAESRTPSPRPFAQGSGGAAVGGGAPSVGYADLVRWGACRVRRDHVAALFGGAETWTQPVTAAEAQAAGVSLEEIAWAVAELAAESPDAARRLRLWSADCAARVLDFYERGHASPAVREAIVAARHFARGDIGREDLFVAWRAAAYAAFGTTASAYQAVCSAACAARRPHFELTAAAIHAADSFTLAGLLTARNAERQWQFDRLVLWLSADEPEDWPLPARPTAGVAS